MTTSVETANRVREGVLPPGPPLPVALQTLLVWRYRHRFMPACRARYGDIFTLRSAPHDTLVVISRPEDIHTVFSGPASVYHAGEGNIILGPVMGEHSVLLLDEARHLRQRRRLLPPFQGEAVRRYTGMIEDLTAAEVDWWPVGRPFAAHPRMQAVTLEVIMRAVFGVTDDERLAQLRPMLRKLAGLDLLVMFAWLYPGLDRFGPWRSYRRLLDETDELLFDEIRRRRSAPDLGDRDDILSQLLHDDGAQNGALTDEELRDQLITLLLAGHETTATSLAWTLHELVHRPEVLHRAQEAADAGDEEYLGAVVKETLRLRPVIYNVARRLTTPTDVAGYRLPAGTIVLPSIGLAHQDPGRYEAPEEFRPERFLGTQPPAYGWIPFGGGVRRCLGAGLALLEARTVLGVVLRAVEPAPATPRPERPRTRHITLVPENGARIVVTARRG